MSWINRLKRLFVLGAWRPRTFPLQRHYHAYLARRHLRTLHPAFAINRAALLKFDSSTAEGFTQLGAGLGELHTQLNSVASDAGEFDLMLQDKDEDRALTSAFDLFKKSVDLVHSSIGIALSQEEQMEQIEGSLLKNRGRFSHSSVIFRVLVMQIRTEAARIEPENRAIFSSVAGEIETMERQMTATVGAAFAQLEDIAQEATVGRQQLRSLQSNLHERAQGSIALLRGLLAKIKLSLAPCAEASRHISQLLAHTRTQSTDLITSLQYQDIVRQQLEHISLGFEDIARHLAPAAAGESRDLGYLHHAARVQQTQLGAARSAIEKASFQIVTGSDALLKTSAELVARFGDMEKAAKATFDQSKMSDLFALETDKLVQIAGQSESTNQRISRLLERIELSVQVFSTDIRRHEFELQLVALNAQIAAARIPGAGALNKLAEETSQVSGNTARLTREMSTQLDETLTNLRRIRLEAEAVRETVGQEKLDLVTGSVTVNAKLVRFNNRIQHTSLGVAREFTAAYRGLHDVLGSLHFSSIIDSSFAPAGALCERLLAATINFGEAEVSTVGSELLKEHRSRYTMREERALDGAPPEIPLVTTIAGASAVVAVNRLSEDSHDLQPAVVPDLPPPSTPDMGDNVELF